MWDGGLQEQEVLAIEKIKAAFSVNVSKPDKPFRSGSISEQLKSYGFIGNEMFPWKGYAGFRFVEAKKEGEFDLVIVTHCNVIIVELKDWNHQPVTARGDTWFKGDKNMGRSPVSVTRSKKFMLDKKLKRLVDRFTNKGYIPIVHFFVVMTGNADFSALPEEQRRHTISLKDFLGNDSNLLIVFYVQIMPDDFVGNDSNLLIVFYVQIMPDDFVMQLHRF